MLISGALVRRHCHKGPSSLTVVRPAAPQQVAHYSVDLPRSMSRTTPLQSYPVCLIYPRSILLPIRPTQPAPPISRSGLDHSGPEEYLFAQYAQSAVFRKTVAGEGEWRNSQPLPRSS